MCKRCRRPARRFQYLLTLRILDGFDLASMERNGIEHLDTVYRAIRLAAGTRIAHNNPSLERLAQRCCRMTRSLNFARACATASRSKDPTEQFVGSPCSSTPRHSPSPTRTAMSCASPRASARSSAAAWWCRDMACASTTSCIGAKSIRAARMRCVPEVRWRCRWHPASSRVTDEPVLALGTPGSYGICQTQPQALIQHVDFGLGMQDAIEEPRARLWDGRHVQVESRIPAATIVALCERGHAAEADGSWTPTVGGMHGIAINPDTGVMTGGCDPRRDGFVAAA